MRALLIPGLIAFAAACSPQTNETGERFTANGQVIAMGGGDGGAANACFSCHGLDGAGDGVSAPRLAGLDVGHLQKQLEDYAGGLRRDNAMTAIAKRLDDADRRAVAAWYASLPLPPGPAVAPGPAPAAYRTRCAVCHGAGGEGIGAANPALAGQPAAYTIDQLRRWRSGERRNDPRGVMSAAAAALTAAETRAIAAWLETAPTAPAPASGVASASAAAAAAARPAASREGRRPGR